MLLPDDDVLEHLAFSGTVSPFGVGTTTLTLYYGRSADNLTEEVILASGADGDDAVEFTSEAITCGKPVRMPEVFYKLVLEEIDLLS